MSAQTKVDNPDQIGNVIERFIESGSEEFLVHHNDDGSWHITADKRKFWSWLLIPSEVKELQKENKRLRQEAEKIQDLLNTYYDDAEDPREVMGNINLLVQKILL